MSVKTPRFEGPFKWSALRQQLLSLREDIQSIRKLPGRNVTIDEHRGKGKVINVASDASRRGGGGAGDCPPPNPCTLDFTLSAPNGFSATQSGLDMYIGNCVGNIDDPSAPGWKTNHWYGINSNCSSNCVDPDCATGDNSMCEDDRCNCQCGWRGHWNQPSDIQFGFADGLSLRLNFIVNDPNYDTDGWWLLPAIRSPDGVGNICVWGQCQFGTPYMGVFLGSDSSIFDSDLNLSLTLPNGGFCTTPGDATLDVTFHPCA